MSLFHNLARVPIYPALSANNFPLIELLHHQSQKAQAGRCNHKKHPKPGVHFFKKNVHPKIAQTYNFGAYIADASHDLAI